MARVDRGPYLRAALFAWSASALACAAPVAPALEHPPAADRGTEPVRAPELGALRYTFLVDASLERLNATLCFEGTPPPELVPGTEGAAQRLQDAVAIAPNGERVLEVREGRILLQGLESGSCIRYTVVFERTAPRWPPFDVARRGQALMTNTALWLWRPPHWDLHSDATARFELPVGMQLSLPWQQRGELYVLDSSAFAFYSYAVFGRFEVEQIDAAGVRMEVVVLEGLSPGTRANVRPWLERAVRTAAIPTGRFPREWAQTVVVPLGPGGEAVPFGMMTRGGCASAAFLVAADAELSELQRSWVAVHEFAHLFVPFVERKDLWLSEGLATYYQEVLRARAATVPAAEAWQKLHDGALLGREVGRSLADEAAQVFETREFSRIYWAGAALALIADVELRRRSQGRQTLEALLHQIAHHAPIRPVSAHDVLTQLDRLAGAPIFAELCERWVHGPEFPQLEALYARLGIELGPAGPAFKAGPDAWIRDAIMRAR